MTGPRLGIRSALPLAIAMLVGEVFLESMSTGIITQEEIDWLTTHQAAFSREEEAMALKIGRLLDEGTIQIGCRLLSPPDGVSSPDLRTGGTPGHSPS